MQLAELDKEDTRRSNLVKRRTSHEPNLMTVWVDSNNSERLFESNVEINSVEPNC